MSTATLSIPAIECISDSAQFAALRPDWNELSDASEAGIFTRWEWLYPWARRIAPERELRIFVGRDAQQIPIGILPLALERRALAGLEVRRLSFLGENHVGSDYLDAVVRRASEEQMAACFAGALRDAADQWDLLDLRDLRSDSPLLGALQSQFADPDYEVILSDRFVCPFETLVPGQPFEAFLRRIKRGSNYSRRRKWLELQPGFEIERVDQPERLARPLSEFFHLHRLRWASDGGSQGIKGTGVEGFHRDAAQLLAEHGKVRFYTLRLRGRALSSVYGLVDRGKFIYFQAGYDPQWRDKSVGLVLVGETFRDSIESGLLEYDFLRGQESYKSDWTTQQRRTVAIRLFNRRGIGSWFHRSEQWLGTARAMSKKWLPQTTVERIRRARRARQSLS